MDDRDRNEGRVEGPIEGFMEQNHARVASLLRGAVRPDGQIDPHRYAVFQRALLSHMAMEDNVLLPFASAAQSEALSEIISRLRAAHRELARLAAQFPSIKILRELQALLEEHHTLEKGAVGFYAFCDSLRLRPPSQRAIQP